MRSRAARPRHPRCPPGRRRAGVALGEGLGTPITFDVGGTSTTSRWCRRARRARPRPHRGWGTHRAGSLDIVTLGAGGVDRHVARAHPAVGRAGGRVARPVAYGQAALNRGDRCQSFARYLDPTIPSARAWARGRSFKASSGSARRRHRAMAAARVCTTAPIRMPTHPRRHRARAASPATSPCFAFVRGGAACSAWRVSRHAEGRVRSSPRCPPGACCLRIALRDGRSDSVRGGPEDDTLRAIGGLGRRAARASPAVRRQGGDQCAPPTSAMGSRSSRVGAAENVAGRAGLAQRVRGLPCRPNPVHHALPARRWCW